MHFAVCIIVELIYCAIYSLINDQVYGLNILRILSTTIHVNTSNTIKNTIKKTKIGQILDVTNNILYILLLNQFIPDIIASR